MLSKLFVWFIFYSFLGWIYESCYCTINEHKWQNRGFLFGPIVPIYGFGGLFGSITFFFLPVPFLQEANNIQVFLICAAGSFVLEYTTHFTLEKLFHAYWWDYSNMPLNINGRVCPIFTCCFGIAGVLVVRYLIPFVLSWPLNDHEMLVEFIALLFMMILGMDMALTISTLSNFNKNFIRINDEINAQIAEAYASLEENLGNKKDALAETIGDKKDALAETLGDKKDAIAESLGDKKDAIFEMREKLTSEAIANYIKNLPKVQKDALLHASGFKTSEKNHEALMSRAIGVIKENRITDRIRKKKS